MKLLIRKKKSINKIFICTILFGFISCSSSSQNETQKDTLFILNSNLSTNKYSYTESVENLDEKYSLEKGILNQTITTTGKIKIELKNVNRISIICSSVSDSSVIKPNINGILKVEYKGKDITTIVKELISKNLDGYALSREYEYEELNVPIFITLADGYILFVHREFIYNFKKL